MSNANNSKPANAAPHAEALWKQIESLPSKLSVEIPVEGFTVRQLMEMEAGTVVETRCGSSSDVPLKVNSQLIGWAEFDLVSEHLAVRFTELA